MKTKQSKSGEDAVADIILNQVTKGKGYLREVGEKGISDQPTWAVQKGRPVYTVRWGSTRWATNVRVIADQVKADRRKRGALWEETVKQGMMKQMRNEIMIATTEVADTPSWGEEG